MGLSVAWIAFIFSADATPGHEVGAKVQAVLIAIRMSACIYAGPLFLPDSPILIYGKRASPLPIESAIAEPLFGRTQHDHVLILPREKV